MGTDRMTNPRVDETPPKFPPLARSYSRSKLCLSQNYHVVEAETATIVCSYKSLSHDDAAAGLLFFWGEDAYAHWKATPKSMETKGKNRM
jgi:hypothetical protein